MFTDLRPKIVPSHRMVALALPVSLLLAGCDSANQPRMRAKPLEDSAVEAQGVPDPRPRPSPPVLARLAYDDTTRTLTTYELPDRGARWKIILPGEQRGMPLQHAQTLPVGVIPERVMIYYTVPGGGASTPVTLAEIMKSQLLQVQR